MPSPKPVLFACAAVLLGLTSCSGGTGATSDTTTTGNGPTTTEYAGRDMYLDDGDRADVAFYLTPGVSVEEAQQFASDVADWVKDPTKTFLSADQSFTGRLTAANPENTEYVMFVDFDVAVPAERIQSVIQKAKESGMVQRVETENVVVRIEDATINRLGRVCKQGEFADIAGAVVKKGELLVQVANITDGPQQFTVTVARTVDDARQDTKTVDIGEVPARTDGYGRMMWPEWTLQSRCEIVDVKIVDVSEPRT